MISVCYPVTAICRCPFCRLLAVLASLLFLCTGFSLSAAAAEKVPVFIYKQGWLRIVYETHGINAVNPADTDHNGIPDFVEDAARQLLAARHVFCDVYGFRDPLASPLYPRVSAVVVRVLHRTNMRSAHGQAFSETIPVPGEPHGGQALVIRLAKDLNIASSATLVHEYFHLFQYGMSHFSANWFTEGMARWAENALAVRELKATSVSDMKTVLNDAHFLEILQTTSYAGATMLWNPLSLACDRHPLIPLPANDPLPGLRYSDGTPVLKDRLFPGARLIRSILENLAAQEENMARRGRPVNRKTACAPASFPLLIRAVREGVAACPD